VVIASLSLGPLTFIVVIDDAPSAIDGGGLLFERLVVVVVIGLSLLVGVVTDVPVADGLTVEFVDVPLAATVC
jgi:hypothetical protein